MREREPGRRQQAEHDGGTAYHLRPEHLAEIGFARLMIAHGKTGGEDRKTDGGQDPRLAAPLELYRNRRGQHLDNAGDQHDLADFEGRMAAHESEEERHEIGRAEEPHAEREAQRAAGGEIAVGEQSQVDDRPLARQCYPHKADAGENENGKEPEHHDRYPAAVGRLLERDFERGGKRRNTAEKTSGMSTPPAKPWTMREATRVTKSTLAAQAIEASVKTPVARTNSPRMVSARVKYPVSGMAMTSAMR